MTIITIMLVFILYTVIHFTHQNLEQTSVDMMNDIAANPFYLMTPTDHFDVRMPYFSLRLNHQGELLESGGSFLDLSDHTFIDTVVNSTLTASENTGILKDYNLRFMRLSTPTNQFLIFVDISTEISTMKNLTRNCIFIGIISFLAFLGISIFFANWSVKPVDLAWTQQKQFIADASHELKTPLTVILTNAEFLQSGEYKEEQKMQFSDNILTMAKQMRGLVEGLLELSRVDNHSMKASMEHLNFSDLVTNSICVFEPLYYETGLELLSDIESDICVKGNTDYLKQVIDILLDNALKYADANSQIFVNLAQQKNHLVFSVKSVGDSISPEDCRNIFKRFYRVDQSRNDSGSYGLGLSIAQSIVLEHKGKIWVESKNGINTFFVTL